MVLGDKPEKNKVYHLFRSLSQSMYHLSGWVVFSYLLLSRFTLFIQSSLLLFMLVYLTTVILGNKYRSVFFIFWVSSLTNISPSLLWWTTKGMLLFVHFLRSSKLKMHFQGLHTEARDHEELTQYSKRRTKLEDFHTWLQDLLQSYYNQEGTVFTKE